MIARIPDPLHDATRSPVCDDGPSAATVPPDAAQAAPRAPTRRDGATSPDVAALAQLLARGALRALARRRQVSLALSPELEPSCGSAESARRTDRDGRDGDQP